MRKLVQDCRWKQARSLCEPNWDAPMAATAEDQAMAATAEDLQETLLTFQ